MDPIQVPLLPSGGHSPLHPPPLNCLGEILQLIGDIAVVVIGYLDSEIGSCYHSLALPSFVNTLARPTESTLVPATPGSLHAVRYGEQHSSERCSAFVGGNEDSACVMRIRFR